MKADESIALLTSEPIQLQWGNESSSLCTYPRVLIHFKGAN